MHGGPRGTIIRMHALVRGDVVAFDRSGDGSKAMSAALAANWRAVALRGALALVFGVAALSWPGGDIQSLVRAFAVFCLVDGALGIVAAIRHTRRHQRWGLLLANGLFGMTVAALTAFWPGIDGLALVALIAAWSLGSGCLTAISAFRLRASHGRDWLALGGVLAVLAGALLVAALLTGTAVVAWWVGVEAVLVGGTLLMLGARLRGRSVAG
jgi:uncharacterized membrane protein HdeD (DUF308 family)